LAAEEFPWRDEGGADQFLDLVAEKGRVVLTIECKKTQKGTMTFLRPALPRLT
jgi:Holliday junction resolvase